jgi:hypothetical protein
MLRFTRGEGGMLEEEEGGRRGRGRTLIELFSGFF